MQSSTNKQKSTGISSYGNKQVRSPGRGYSYSNQMTDGHMNNSVCNLGGQYNSSDFLNAQPTPPNINLGRKG